MKISFQEPVSVFCYNLIALHHDILWYIILIISLVFWVLVKILKEYSWYTFKKEKKIEFFYNNVHIIQLQAWILYIWIYSIYYLLKKIFGVYSYLQKKYEIKIIKEKKTRIFKFLLGKEPKRVKRASWLNLVQKRYYNRSSICYWPKGYLRLRERMENLCKKEYWKIGQHEFNKSNVQIKLKAEEKVLYWFRVPFVKNNILRDGNGDFSHLEISQEVLKENTKKVNRYWNKEYPQAQIIKKVGEIKFEFLQNQLVDYNTAIIRTSKHPFF